MKAWIAILCILLSIATPAYGANIVVVGDSLSAAFGIQTEDGWVSLLQTRLSEQDYDYQVINASISGETTAGGLSQLPALLEHHQPAVLILALGANDGLRGLSLESMQINLAKMVQLAKKQSVKILLIGMQLPPNYGQTYARLFFDSYSVIAKKHEIPLVPFLLDGIGEDKNLFQRDGLHPTAAAQTQILDNIWPTLEKLL